MKWMLWVSIIEWIFGGILYFIQLLGWGWIDLWILVIIYFIIFISSGILIYSSNNKSQDRKRKHSQEMLNDTILPLCSMFCNLDKHTLEVSLYTFVKKNGNEGMGIYYKNLPEWENFRKHIGHRNYKLLKTDFEDLFQNIDEYNRQINIRKKKGIERINEFLYRDFNLRYNPNHIFSAIYFIHLKQLEIENCLKLFKSPELWQVNFNYFDLEIPISYSKEKPEIELTRTFIKKLSKDNQLKSIIQSILDNRETIEKQIKSIKVELTEIKEYLEAGGILKGKCLTEKVGL